MSTFLPSDERIFEQLVGSVRHLIDGLSPLTERFASVDVFLRQLSERQLNRFALSLRIGVIGPSKSGKSSVINALLGLSLLPVDVPTTVPVTVCHHAEAQAILCTPAGRAIALGPDAIRAHLRQANVDPGSVPAELSDPVLKARLISMTTHENLPWRIIDHPASAKALHPKVSSVASRCCTPDRLVADVLLLCIDIRRLGRPELERDLFSHLLTGGAANDHRDDGQWTAGGPSGTVSRLASRTIFVLTFADYITDLEDGVEHALKRDSDVEGGPGCTTLAEARSRFDFVCNQLLGHVPDASRVVVCSAANAVLARTVLRTHRATTMRLADHERPSNLPLILKAASDGPEPTIADLYNYAENIMGSPMLHKIDAYSEEDLRRIMMSHSMTRSLKRTGATAIGQALEVVDFNAIRELLASAAVGLAEAVESVGAGADLGLTILQAESRTAHENAATLSKELRLVQEMIADIQRQAQRTLEGVRDRVDELLREFVERRLCELGYVLDHRGYEWYADRQIGIIKELNTSLQKFEEFIVTFLQQRVFVQQRLSGRPGDTTVANDSGNDGFLSGFLQAKSDTIVQAMETHRREKLTSFCCNFSHHIRDEFLIFLEQTLKPEVRAVLRSHLKELVAVSRKAVNESTARTGRALDVDRASGLLFEAELFEQDTRRINNFTRELPEYAAASACEIAQDSWMRAFKSMVARADGALPQPGSAAMTDALKYVPEGWRLVLSTAQVEHFCQSNLEDFAGHIGRFVSSVVEVVGEYAASVSDGLEEERRLATDTDASYAIMDAKRSEMQPLRVNVSRMLNELANVCASDITDVSHQQTAAGKRRASQMARPSTTDR